MKNPSFSLVAWAYNEEMLIDAFIIKADYFLKNLSNNYEIIVVDDASKDLTYIKLKKLQKKFPKLRVLRNKKNRNVGYCCKKAIKAAQKDIIFWQTVDWCYDISTVSKSLRYLETHDVLAGVRRKPVDATGFPAQVLKGIIRLFHVRHLTRRSDSVWKAIISVVNYSLIRTLFQIPLSDYQNVVFYPKSFIQNIKVESRSSFANPELLLKAHWSGLAIKEIPVNFIPRAKGIAKGTRFKSILKSICDIFYFWIKWKIVGSFRILTHGRIDRLHI